MLTIGRLAAYAGVTIRTVRHYHQVGLLPEPERDASGYRRYGAGDVVALIKIRTLADAGVPLSEIDGLLRAGPAGFAEAVQRIDARLAGEIARRQTSREQIARLAAGDVASLPPEVIDYLRRLRELGVSERILAGERDGWIIMAARWPDEVVTWIPAKIAQLQDPRLVRLYLLMSEAVDDGAPDDSLLTGIVDLLAALLAEAEWTDPGEDLPFDLLDALADEAGPRAERLRQMMRERGWDGWTRQRRVS
ncbi:MerR family transcriptional regulator [Actinoplanes couchii]|uniref:MerR family transcriptional regulator n=1 Tax=Actinoplanes couchii TaxID=403638 RepID=A0ABQ3X221_9ACTN|nr:MerR family transcriptional regulator [Actinoplanes couchii]MDR6316959.1 DNA-binding transcriptional MerR regulator [Actinoplanes couchii]GID52567.1 MerR family transcriptional regulator [Actinoplanes couchii]